MRTQSPTAERIRVGATHRGSDAIRRLIAFAPASGALALWARHADVDDEGAEPVITDGSTIFYGPDFPGLPLDEQAGRVALAVLHIALRHGPRFAALDRRQGGADRALFGLCADALVATSLDGAGWLHLPPSIPRLGDLLATINPTPGESSVDTWDVERLYLALDTRDQRSGRHRGRMRGSQGGDGDASRQTEAASGGASAEDGSHSPRLRAILRTAGASVLRPTAAAEEPREIDEATTRAWRSRLEHAHVEDGAFSMLRGLVADLPRSRTPWEQILRTRLARHLAPTPSVSWSRPARSWLANGGRAGPHRRMPWEPGRSASTPTPRLALVIDVSGSIDERLLGRFTEAIRAIARRTGAAVTLVVGDDRVRHVETFAPARFKLPDVKTPGGGGTDFAPLLAEAARHRPDIGVVLTDLEGPAGAAPPFPVLWAVPEASAATSAPFGRVLVLD